METKRSCCQKALLFSLPLTIIGMLILMNNPYRLSKTTTLSLSPLIRYNQSRQHYTNLLTDSTKEISKSQNTASKNAGTFQVPLINKGQIQNNNYTLTRNKNQLHDHNFTRNTSKGHKNRSETKELNKISQKKNAYSKNQIKKTNRNEIKILQWTTYYNREYNTLANEELKYSNCPIKQYTFHRDKSSSGISSSDAVLFHMWTKDFNKTTPVPEIRFPWQSYIFFTLENPTRAYFKKSVNMTDLDGFFNLTATYKSDSDIPIPYGKYYPILKQPSKQMNYYKENKITATNKSSLIIWIVSHCETLNKREDFVKELKKHVNVDVFGQCGKPCKSRKCGNHPYMFYLALENADCKDYITEKLWKNAFQQNLIPIVRGSKIGYKKHLPPHSFINANDFKSVKDLAIYITKVSQDEALYNSYFKWKNNYRISFSIGFYNTYYVCRLCMLLQKRRKDTSLYKTYNISSWFDANDQCALY